MLRIDSTILRILLLGLSIAGLILFSLPLSFRIINTGNVVGLSCSTALLLFVIFNKWISAFLGKISEHKTGKITLYVLGGAFLLALLYFLIVSICMMHAAYKKPQEQPKAMIVLGCRVRGETPSLMLWRRIHAAYDVLAANPDMRVIVSGGKGSDEMISEAQCMYNELTKLGIAPERILMEDRSTTTSENLRFSKKILEEQGITGSLYLVTDGYHELRGQMLAKKENLPDCYPAAAHTSWYLLPTYWVREWFGVAHAVVFGR